MVLCTRQFDSTEQPTTSSKAYSGGPVFLPRRTTSALALDLLKGPGLTEDRITAYDEAWLRSSD